MGKDPDPRILQLAKNDPQVVLTGFIKELDTYLKKTRVFIVPLRFGSGMKVKVLEGLYRGVPMVSTSVGAEGLEVRSGEELLIADQGGDFAQACLELLDDSKLWGKLSVNSRKLAAEKYRWSDLLQQMQAEIKALSR
jgi:glycosyltransferase involved in cell wall biosynthesis